MGRKSVAGLSFTRWWHALAALVEWGGSEEESSMVKDGLSALPIRVRYAETDQMGVAHHSHYLVWCEAARTEHMRRLGADYRALEEEGLRLVVVEAQVR